MRSWFLPFTIALMLAIFIASWLGHDHRGELDPGVASQVSHAPRHWHAGQWLGLLTSIPFTADRTHLIAALLMSAACVGTCERLRGTWVTMAVFTVVHLATLILLSAGFFLGHFLLTSHATRQLIDNADVGPSAGYYGCLGYLLVSSRHRFAWTLCAGVPAYILLRVNYLVFAKPFDAHAFQTEAAHGMAFAIGSTVSWLTKNKRTRNEPTASP